MIRIVLPAPLSDALRNVYLSFAMHVMTLLPMIHRGIGGLGIASARYRARKNGLQNVISTTQAGLGRLV